ncbi:Fe-S cluster assembly sulfur transfer protein SufU [Corynebacterium amycolatum]|uniref:Fe-S cluster assembly sulfur transfer protein SufU n=1 Tax=Corynebacterium amycolatum TaxID=43765 RepID=UPI000C764824|nr:SUF system NifU family Fe-S cluster assembly protein [Corynebacterium amycolatum]MDK7315569.1 SUF system NifU family Fe-S cluster assembly protein [Corynebacterium amycolatum]PKZ21294.1 SUF system NifU family Fe-S cluster assembly protein [Corynebacterium amycolatum]
MKLEQMYQEVILDHYKHPQHAGLREPFNTEVHHVNPSCGDELTLRVTLNDDLTVVNDVSYDAVGCSISQASTSVMAEEIVGKTVDEAMAKLAEFEKMVTSRGKIEGDEDIIGDGIAFAGVSKYPARVKCALLGWKAFQAATAEALASAAEGNGVGTATVTVTNDEEGHRHD